MNRKNDVEALLNRADKAEGIISEAYGKALHSQEISAELRIDIKDFFGSI